MKKTLFVFLSFICVLCCVFAFVACDSSNNETVTVVSIKLTSSTERQDTYTITYSDGSEDFFTVTNGEQGIQGIQGEKGQDGHTPVITIGSNGNWFVDGVDSLIKAQGTKGDKGDSGVGITSIVKTSTNGLVDTYTVTFTDNTTTTFTVTNGEQGIRGIQGEKGQDGHTPVITIGNNGNWFIDGIDSNQKAQGLQGLSAYELYVKNNPDYTKSEREWLNDLACGHLGQVTITFDSDGGTSIETQTIGFGTYAESRIPKKDGYIFKCWTLNGSEIDINTFAFFSDSKLVAKYTSRQFDITLNADGGSIENNTIHIQYGEAYSLPTPIKQYMSFANWSLGDVKIPNSGIWTYSGVSVQLKAIFNTTKIYANLSVDSNYGSLDTTRERLTVGESFKLPVPTVVEGGLSFQGWYNGDVKYTDKDGNSLNILKDTETLNLTASFYTEINNVHQIIAMGSAESTSGNFVVTRDLDFAGLEMTPINNFSGVFDGNGHTLKNITINKGVEDYGGFFGTIAHSSTIKNVKFDNLDLCGDWREWQNGQHFGRSGGLVGRISKTKNEDMEINISNIAFANSVNNSTNMSSGFGMVVGLLINNVNPYPNAANYQNSKPPKGFDIGIKNINIVNCGNSFQDYSSYCIGSLNLSKSGTYSDYQSSEKQFINIYPACIEIDGLKLVSSYVHSNQVYGIIANPSAATGVSGEPVSSDYHYNSSVLDLSKIAHVYINGFENNVNGLIASITRAHNRQSINVSNSANNGNTSIAWGGVNALINCINTGVCSYWGAVQSDNCFDVAEKGTYTFSGYIGGAGTDYSSDCIKNSLILFENADGSYYCFTSGGQLSTVSNITLITKDWLVSFLSFDEQVWNLDDFDLSNKIYPSLLRNDN